MRCTKITYFEQLFKVKATWNTSIKINFYNKLLNQKSYKPDTYIASNKSANKNK